MQSYLIGGRLGDFIHSLAIPKFVYETYGYKSNIYMAEIGDTFSNGLENTFEELKPIMADQVWVNKFEIYTNQDISIRLCDFRTSPHMYSTCWNEILFKTFLPINDVPMEYKWLSTQLESQKKEIIFINRSNRRPMSSTTRSYYEHIFSSYSSFKFVFICSDIHQYESFEMKEQTELLLCPTLKELVDNISTGRMFVGNQSTPFAIASALNIPRVVELLDSPDRIHYMNDTKYYKDMNYFQGD